MRNVLHQQTLIKVCLWEFFCGRSLGESVWSAPLHWAATSWPQGTGGAMLMTIICYSGCGYSSRKICVN